MYTSKPKDNDILREVAMLQAVHGWSWSIVWVPREMNEAADALSKADLRKFERLQPGCTRRIPVSPADVGPPRLVVRGAAHWNEAGDDPARRDGFSGQQRDGGRADGGDVCLTVDAQGRFVRVDEDRRAEAVAVLEGGVAAGWVGGATRTGMGRAWAAVTASTVGEVCEPSERGAGCEPACEVRRALQRPIRQVISQPLGGEVSSSSGLEDRLREQLRGVRRLVKPLCATSGVRSYLRFAQRMRWSKDRFLPRPSMMVENLCMYALDAVQAYVWAVGAMVWPKKAILPSSIKSYLTEIAKWYDEETGHGPQIHLRQGVKDVMKILSEAYPKGTRQKEGLSAANVRALVRWLRTRGGPDALMWEAAFTLAWFGMLRPGECVAATRGGFDAASNPTQVSVEFFGPDGMMTPGHGGVPTHMRFVVRKSKTDQDRLTKDVFIGATGDAGLCAVAAMWAYMATQPRMHSRPLFVLSSGAPAAYRDLYVQLAVGVVAVGLDRRRFGAHSFRIGGAQALAAAGRSIPYIMAYGRWTCTESVLRYVKTPEYMRRMDAVDMIQAKTEHPWQHVLQVDREANALSGELWCARQMAFPTCFADGHQPGGA